MFQASTNGQAASNVITQDFFQQAILQAQTSTIDVSCMI